MSTAFLTGASGFLGGHLLRELVAAGHRVRALSRWPETDAAIAALGGTPVRGSLADTDALPRALDGCEAVFHAAADTSLWRPHAAAQLATDFVHRVGAALGRRTPRGATPAWVLMAYDRVLDGLSRLTRREPDVTPEGAALTSHRLHVDSSRAKRELDYVETPLNALLAGTLAWMRAEGMLSG
ncbi:NAD(P)H-binding protein [Dyella sp. KRB-257]|uniref:NAD(P)H-binding protein n=1 Tax=Dyella sp. KRB-257 TaxID=3400915 RepID=UPI003C0CE542